MEFKPINTQEELDAVIRSRLERERSKFADYDQIKTSNAELQNALEQARSEAAAAAKTAAGRISELEKQAKEHEIASVKMRIATEYGIPTDLRDRLRGETEEDIKKDAETIAPLFASKAPPAPPLYNPESGAKNPVDAAWKQLLDNTKFM
jgi:hypothetical protein